MSLNSALSVAKSALGTTATRAEIVSRNISNSDTPGYVRKTVQTETLQSGGVKVASIDRRVDQMLNRLDRSNISDLAHQRQLVDGMTAYTDILGQPNDETSPAAYLSQFNTDLAALAISPNSSAAQQSALASAKALAENLNAMSSVLDGVASEVNASIALDVGDLNAALNEVANINLAVLQSPDGSMELSNQQDRLDRALDTIAGIMDVKITTDGRGMTQIHSSGGTELLVNNKAATIGFDMVGGTLRAGEIEITPGATTRGFASGSLAGLFEMRDRTLPAWQADLDTIAGGLVEGTGRLAELTPDSGIGLFTDAGNAYDPEARAGLAARIAINEVADPARGGEVAVLHSGGDPARLSGDTSVIDGMLDAINTPVQVDVADGSAQSPLVSLVPSIVARQQSERVNAETGYERQSVSASITSSSRSNMQGVDVDEELQNLLAIQQAYAANAKIVSTASEMIDSLIAAV